MPSNQNTMPSRSTISGVEGVVGRFANGDFATSRQLYFSSTVLFFLLPKQKVEVTEELVVFHLFHISSTLVQTSGFLMAPHALHGNGVRVDGYSARAPSHIPSSGNPFATHRQANKPKTLLKQA